MPFHFNNLATEYKKRIFAPNFICMQNKEKNLIIIVSIAFIVIILVLGFFFLRQNKEYQNVVHELTLDRNTLATEFQELMFEYDSLKPENDTLLIILDREQQKVAQLMEELETVKVTNAAKIREYRKELGTMRTVLRHYVVQIDSLNRLNDMLTQENQSVKQKYQKVTDEVSVLVQEKEHLTETVERAMQLEALDINIITLTSKNRETNRLSKIARLKIEFTLSKNITAPTGDLAIYVRVSAPNGEVFFVDESDLFFYENKKINYSCMRVVEYEGEELPVTLYWDVNKYIFAGDYHIDIFANAYHIGHKILRIND